MARDNVEVIREFLEATNKALRSGDVTLVLDEFVDPEIDWRAVEGAIDDVGGMRGHDDVRRYVEDWGELFDDLEATPEELTELDDEPVMARLRIRGRAKQSGIETDLTFAVVYTIRGGRLAKVREYGTTEDALEAAGLSE
jgi:ketosteroid isomerase-like protein